MIGKINPYSIAHDHFLTLSSNKTGKVSFNDIILFYLLPILVAIPLAIYCKPSDSLSNIFITSLSVFAALLFNLLLLALDVIKKEKGSENANARILLLMKHTYNNIAYAILIALISISILLIPYLYNMTFGSRSQQITWAIIYFLVINFMLTMAMILKRMHVILAISME